MTYPRLLAGLLVAASLSAGVCVNGQRVITLDEIFLSAESHSLNLRPAIAAEAEARQAVGEARATRLPDITASATVSYIGDGFTTRRDFSDYQRAPIPHFGNTLNVNIGQPVYAGGAITAGIELAELKLTAARLSTDLARDNIRIQLTGFYLDIFKYRNLRSVVEQNISRAALVLDEMRARHEQGVALLNDITRYELLLSNLSLQLTKIDNTLRILNTNLVAIAGLPDGAVVVPDSTILLRSLPTAAEADWQDEARRNAPSLSLARTSLDISRKAETLTRAARLPKVGLQAGWSTEGPILVEVPPINRNLSYWYVGIGISYDISSLFKTNRSLARARAATVTAADRLASAEQDTELAVHADFIRYLEAYEELATQEKSVELAERNYLTVFTRYSADMALITDMLDAANANLDAQQRLVNARIDIIYYYYKLLFTSGQI